MNKEDPSVFDYLDSINQTKEDIMTPENESKYNSYLINKYLSGRIDTVLPANVVNACPFMDKRLQYDYLRHVVRRKFRRVKWVKSEPVENIKLIQQYYKCNVVRAKEFLQVLSDEKINEIREFLDPGGTK